jgi:hypothetical protein
MVSSSSPVLCGTHLYLRLWHDTQRQWETRILITMWCKLTITQPDHAKRFRSILKYHSITLTWIRHENLKQLMKQREKKHPTCGAVVRSMFEINISAGHLWGRGFDSRSNPLYTMYNVIELLSLWQRRFPPGGSGFLLHTLQIVQGCQ